MSAGYYFWDTYYGKNIKGFRGELKLQVTPHLSIGGGISADNQDTTGFLRLSLSLGAPMAHEFSLVETGFTAEPFRRRDLARHVLTPVKRHHRIVLQRRSVNKATGAITAGVVVGRW